MRSNARVGHGAFGVLTLIAAMLLSLSIFAKTGPAITSISPNSGAPGDAVTILGSGFGASVGSSIVTFNGVAATPQQWSNTSMTATVPTGASTGPVVVNVAGAPSNAVAFTISQVQ